MLNAQTLYFLSLSLCLRGSGVREDHSEAVRAPTAEEQPGAAAQSFHRGLERVRLVQTGGPQEAARRGEDGLCSAHEMSSGRL